MSWQCRAPCWVGTAIGLLGGEDSSVGLIDSKDRLVHVSRIAAGIARGVVVSIDVEAIEAGDLCSKQLAIVAILQGLSQAYQSITLNSYATRGRRP